MIESPRWDLGAYDDASTRARLWRWAPTISAILAVLGVVPAMFAGVAIAVNTGSIGAMIATLLLGYLPALAVLGAWLWHLRRLRRQLPGPELPWTLTLARLLLLVGGAAWVGVATSVLDPDRSFFFVACALGGIALVIPVTAIAAPRGQGLPPWWASPLLAFLFGLPLVPIAIWTWAYDPSEGTAMLAVGVFLVAPALIATRGALSLADQSARGDHAAALAALTHWRIGRLRMVARTGILLLAGRIEDARTMGEAWIQRDHPRSWGTQLQRIGECALWLGDLDALQSIARVALATRPDEPAGYVLAVRHDLATDTVDELTHGLIERALEQSERSRRGGLTASLRQASDEALLAIRLLHARVLARLGNAHEATRERDEVLARLDRHRRAAAALLLHQVADVDQALGEDPEPRRTEARELDPEGIGGRLGGLSAAAG